MNDRVRTTIDGHVAEVMLDRADKHNALDMPMFEALVAAADSLASNPTVRAVVLHGAGDNFCAGIDVSMFSAFAADFDPQLLAPQRGSPGNLFQRAGFAWRELPVPVICAIQGIAWGGGLQVALGADLRYASPAASLSVMEIRWGLIPDMGITATTRGQLRSDVLKELAWTGRVVEAADAAEVGLVTAIHDDPLDTARRTAHDIASRSPDAIRAMKTLFETGPDLSVAESLGLEAKLQGRILATPNQLEAVQANMEKREPQFSDPAAD